MTTTEDPIATQFERVEQRQKLLTDAVRHILEARFSGDLPHASADMVALLGGQEEADRIDFQPRIDKRFDQLGEQNNLLTNAVRYILEGKWGGAMPHATAYVVALMGGEEAANAAGFKPVEFGAAPAETPVGGGETGDNLLTYARTLLGVPYEMHGFTPPTPGGQGWGKRYPDRDKGLDCSGYVLNVLQHAGFLSGLDPDYTNCDVLWSKCTPIAAADVQPGDLVFYEGTYNSLGKTHVGLATVAGGTAMISSRQPGVDEDPIDNGKWKGFAAAYGRLKS